MGQVDLARDGSRRSVRFGALTIHDVRPDDVEDVRDQLTAAVLAYEAAGCTKGEGRLAPKTAQNVWAALTIATKYASTRKGPRELRVREDLADKGSAVVEREKWKPIKKEIRRMKK